MSNPFQEQFLKAGVVTKQQVQKANQAKSKKRKQQRSKKSAVVDETVMNARQVTKNKAKYDRGLNRKKEEDARKKALSTEINQLISQNLIKRDESCDIAYHFEHNNKINRLYVNQEMKQKIIQGSYGIARITGRYELVPKDIAMKIQQRNEKRVILFSDEKEAGANENDPYADFQIPDDLTW